MFGAAAPAHRHRHHPERRVQRALRARSRPGRAAPRPPVRVDPRQFAPGPARVAAATATGPVPARRPGGPEDGPPTQLASSRKRGSDRSDRELTIPELSLVVLVGVTGSGKSTFAAAHFKPTEVISSDFCRGLVADDENDQSATPDAFDVLHYIAGKRLAAGRLTVIDATNVQPEARKPLVALAREHDVLPVAIVLDVPEKRLPRAQRDRPGPRLRPARIRRQRDQLRRGLHGLQRRASARVHVLRGADEIAAAAITRTRLYNDLRHETGPFDVIGDVHGCRAELEELLDELGYASSATTRAARSTPPPRGPAGGVRRRPGRPRPGHAGRAAAGHGHGGGGRRALRARQPRGQAAARAARQERQAQPRPGRVAGAAGRRARGVPRRGEPSSWTG